MTDDEAWGRSALPFSFPERLRPKSAESIEPASRRGWPWVTTAIAALLLVGVFVAWRILAGLTYTGPHVSGLASVLLRLNLTGGAIPVVAYGVAGAALTALVVRAPTRRWLVTSLIALVVGAMIGAAIIWYLTVTDAFGVGLSSTTVGWGIAVFATASFALSNLWKSAAWRKLVAVVAVVLFTTAGFIGINADFGLDRTPADLAGISTQKTLRIPVATAKPMPVATILAGGALWANWHAPRDLPSVGTEGQVVIPSTISGFAARPAGLYLPPAALTANPPALPLVIMMMGQPGNPDVSFSAAILNALAAQHGGLAPIVLVADQIGNPDVDTLCLDTAKHGNSETYITKDVVNWARTHLHVLQDPAHWTIAGYSNGGECALSFGVKYPQLWGNVLDISGDEYPGGDRPTKTLATDFGGNKAAYDAVKPLNQIVGKTYPDTVAIFTVGSDDGVFRGQAKTVFAATTAAGWRTTYFEVPNGGHVLGALNGGLTEGYSVLYPRLGLVAP